MAVCRQCGGPTEYVHDALSHLCLSCGIMSDATQYVLANDSSESNILPEFLQGQTFYRGPKAVYGLHDKENRARRNKAACHAFIRALLNRMEYPGLMSRVENLFDTSMEKGGFRWGQQTSRIIAACAYIALRESSKPESLEDVAAHARVQPSKLSNVLFKILYLHNLKLASSDPLNQVPRALRLVSDLAQDRTLPVPSLLRAFLSAPCLHSVLNLSSSLYHFTNRVFLTHNRATAPVACALVILALEGEARREAPSLSALAALLAKEFGVVKETILDRYIEMQTLILEQKQGLPWVLPEGKIRRKGSAAQRADHATIIKDILEFQEQLEREALRHEAPSSSVEGSDSTMCLDIEADEDIGRSDLSPNHLAREISQPTAAKHSVLPENRPSKRPRLAASSTVINTTAPPSNPPNPADLTGCLRPHYAKLPSRSNRQETVLDHAASSLLSGPHSATYNHNRFIQAPASKCDAGELSSSTTTLRGNLLSVGATNSNPPCGRTTSENWSNIVMGHLPTRLGTLAALKGGSNITDEELFVPGELEAMMKSDDEVQATMLKAQLEGWDDLAIDLSKEPLANQTHRSEGSPVKKWPKKTKATDQEALGRALNRLSAKRKRQEQTQAGLEQTTGSCHGGYIPSEAIEESWEDEVLYEEGYPSDDDGHELCEPNEDRLYTFPILNELGRALRYAAVDYDQEDGI